MYGNVELKIKLEISREPPKELGYGHLSVARNG